MTAFCIISVLGKDYEAPLEQYEWSVDFMRSFKDRQMRENVVLTEIHPEQVDRGVQINMFSKPLTLYEAGGFILCMSGEKVYRVLSDVFSERKKKNGNNGCFRDKRKS